MECTLGDSIQLDAKLLDDGRDTVNGLSALLFTIDCKLCDYTMKYSHSGRKTAVGHTPFGQNLFKSAASRRIRSRSA